MAIMNSFWSIAPISARRTAGLSNGGYRWFGRSRNGVPVRSVISTRDLGLPQQRQQIGRRVLPPVHLARLHRRGLGGVVRLHVPFDAVEMHDLRSGGEAGLAILARLVFVEALIDEQRSLHALVRLEAERAAADHFGELLERIGVGDAAPA